MNTGPNPIDFGVVPPQGGMTAYFMVYDAQSSALLEARITDDDSNGRFSLKMLRSYTKRPVSGGLPHTPWGGPGFNLIETDFTDGTRPLRVFTGQLVGIELRFDDAGTDAQGQFGATLVINDMSPTNRWPEITAKMIAIVASITTTLPAVVDLTQGQPATVPITIVSNDRVGSRRLRTVTLPHHRTCRFQHPAVEPRSSLSVVGTRRLSLACPRSG